MTSSGTSTKAEPHGCRARTLERGLLQLPTTFSVPLLPQELGPEADRCRGLRFKWNLEE